MFDRLLSELRYRWRALVLRGRMEDELDQELRFHVEREAEKLVHQGMSPDEARRTAHVRFGGRQRIAQDTRDVRGVSWVEQGWADLRYALRVLKARPAFTIGVAGTLALGLGANAAMFGIVDRLMFRTPDGLRDADRVHRVHMRYIQDGEPRMERSMQFARFRDFQRSATSVDLVGAFQVRNVAFGTGDQVREERLAVVSASYLSFFDAPPVLGRWFTLAEDEPPTGSPVVVLSHAYWQSAYGGQADVLGRVLQVDRLSATIIGVAPPGFAGINDEGAPVAFVPMSAFAHAFRGTQYVNTYNWSWLEILVRRKPGVSIAEANADLSAAYRVSWHAEEVAQGQTYDVDQWKPSAEVGPVHLGRGPDASLDSRVTLWTTGVALIVLLIACANVANLLLSRAVSRQREIALRLALGVGRWRLTRQLLLEGVLLGVLGGTGGILLARFGGGALRALLLPDADATAVLTDARTVAWSMALAVLAGVLTGVVPSLTAARTDVAGALKEGGRGNTQRRSLLRASLVVTQAALSLVLLVGAGLFVRSLSRAEQHRLGIDVDPVLYAEANMRGVRLNDAASWQLMQRMLDAARATPGVASATMAASVPFWSNEGRSLWVPGVDSIRRLGRFTLQAGNADYFTTTGTRILRGRGFTEADREGAAPVIVVSEAMARAVWPGRDAIGQCVTVSEQNSPCRTVVGIAEETAMRDLQPTRQYTYYLPVDQFREANSAQFFVRVSGAPAAVISSLRSRLQSVLPGAAYIRVIPLRDLITPQLRAWRFGATMFVAFGGLALVLAALGMYSLVSYEVAQREKELGVRLALGAPLGTLLLMVVGRGARLAAVGLALGLVVALGGATLVESLLFQQSPRDPGVIVTVGVMLLVVAVVASVIPAVRAMRTDPNRVLRAD